MVTRRTGASVAVLMAVMVALSGLVFLASASKVNHIRSDFCAWVGEHYSIVHSEPPNGPRRADERSDIQLERKLGCQP